MKDISSFVSSIENIPHKVIVSPGITILPTCFSVAKTAPSLSFTVTNIVGNSAIKSSLGLCIIPQKFTYTISPDDSPI